MPTIISDLSPADQADFEGRLAVLGLTTTSITTPDLVVPANQTVTLSGPTPSAVKPQVLTASSVDQLKSWIGIPDTVFTSNLLSTRLPIPAVSPTLAKLSVAARPAVAAGSAVAAGPIAAAPALASTDLDSIRAATIAYIYGNSTAAAAFKPAIDRVFLNAQIFAWLFFTITVTGTLVLGPGMNSLVAWKIIIGPRGQVVSKAGNMHVSCSILQQL
jgi:hypothetical protein